MRNVDGMTMKEWIDKETKPRDVSLWGAVCKDFSPEICLEIEGNGQQLVYFGTINQRPFYWLMRISSKHNIEDSEFDVEGIIINRLEEEFGIAEDWISEDDFSLLKEEGDEECCYCETYEKWLQDNYDYPKLQIDGYHWGLIVNMVTKEKG